MDDDASASVEHTPVRGQAAKGFSGRGPVILDIGCGNVKRPNRLGIDIVLASAVDVLADVTRGLPLADNSVDGVHMSHFLEHVATFVPVMEEVWRACKPNAWVYIRGPHASCSFATWKDPTHLRPLTLETFRYFGEYHYYNYYTKARFRIEQARLCLLTKGRLTREPLLLSLLSGIVNRMANYSWRAKYRCERWWGPLVGIEEIHVLLRAVK
jgi:SAM-dependent methyltransferase